MKYKKKIFLQLNLFFFLICCLAIHSCTYCIGPPCLIIIYRFSIWEQSKLVENAPSVSQQFWKVLQTVPFFFVTHSGTCSGRPCPPCPPYPAAFYPDARKMWSSTWIFSLPRLQSFYEGREASTREDHLPRGKRRMNEMVCPICCRALTTEHCLRLDYCIHWRLSYYSQRGDTLQAALLTIELLSTTQFETRDPSLSLYMSTATFHRGLKALCSILVSRPKKHSIENLRTKPPLQPPHFTQLKFSHLCLVPQCAILWYPKAPVTIQLWQTPHQASGCKGPSDIQVIMGMGGGWQGC